jgi:transposase
MADNSTQSNIIQELRKQLAEQKSVNLLLLEEHEKLRRQNEFLAQRLDALLRQTYGRKSEKLNPDQLQLFIDGVRSDSEPVPVDPDDETPDSEEPPARIKKKKRGPHPGRAPLPDHLEREEIHLRPDNLDCPCCGHEMEPAGEEISEELGMIPARFFVRRLIRHKVACRQCQDAVVRPPLPAVAIEKCRAGSDVLAAIVVSKYADHLPLYRQQAIYRREGVELSRVTMGNWIGKCAFLLKPVVGQMKAELLATGMVQSDDTGVKYLESPGPAKSGYLWAYVSYEGDVVYDFTTSRSRAGPTSFLAGFQGTLQVDGYTAYNEILATEGVDHAACWAHVRRKFENALKTDPLEAAMVLHKIGDLYGVEKEIRAMDPKPNAAEIDAIRQEKSLPVIHRLEELLVEYREKALPKSPLGQAIQYAFGQWEWLETYIHDGRVEIDNNSCERAMRKVAVGRKNWLFAGSDQGGRNAAVLYSLIETCARLGINPHEYLTDVLVRVGTHLQSRIAELTPRGWLATRADGSA